MDKNEQYERVFNHFDSNGDGKISPSELQQCVETIGGQLSLAEAEATVEFLNGDGDRDRLVGLEDFVRFVEGGVEEKVNYLEEAFKMYEEMDESGCITPTKSLKRMLTSVAKSFQYIIPMFIALLQVNSKESPFKTHPIQTWVFVVATIIYGLTFQLSDAAAAVVAVISGSLSTVSLISIFLPRVLGFLIFIPWSFVSIIVAYQPIHSIFKGIHDACLSLDRQMIMDFISKFSVVWTWLTRSSSSEQVQEHRQPRPRVSP